MAELNKELNAVKYDIAEVDALMCAYENAYLDFDVVPDQKVRYNRSVYAFYAIWEAIQEILNNLRCY